MMIERFRWLAAVIAAHPNREVVGRARLQKTIKLLQRLDLPTDYSYTCFFHGPYSEGIRAEVALLKKLGLVKEVWREPYFVVRAEPDAAMPELIQPFQLDIDIISAADGVALELAAVYDSFRAMCCDHEGAEERMRRKKSSMCRQHSLTTAFNLLENLGLPAT